MSDAIKLTHGHIGNFKSNAIQYTVLQSGYYTLRATVFHRVATGKLITIPNPNRYWFEFYKPRFVEVPEYRCHTTTDGSEVRYLEAGTVIPLDHLISRIQ